MVALALGILLANAFYVPYDNPQGRLDCYQEARAMTTLTEAEAQSLCEFARDSTPVACYNDARSSTQLTKEDALKLCKPKSCG